MQAAPQRGCGLRGRRGSTDGRLAAGQHRCPARAAPLALPWPNVEPALRLPFRPPGAIHETGHSLYEQGRNLKYDGLPVNSVSPCSRIRVGRPRGGGGGGDSSSIAYAPQPASSLLSAFPACYFSLQVQPSLTPTPNTVCIPPARRPWAWACTRARACCGSAWWGCPAPLLPTCCPCCGSTSRRQASSCWLPLPRPQCRHLCIPLVHAVVRQLAQAGLCRTPAVGVHVGC